MTPGTGLEARVAQGLAQVRERIGEAAGRAGRDPGDVRLVAVSKRHPPEAIRAAYGLGLRDFGENYIQELAHKAGALGDLPGIRWHVVGHLQRNKARDATRVATSVDSVDSVRLAEALAKHADKAGRRLPILIQVNVAGETRKAGCAPADLPEVVDAVRALPSLELQGLLTVPPHTDDPEGARPVFRALARLGREHGLAELSMGMTHDLEVAVEEGATMVRIGTALFGPRDGP
jgi:PLP dependent protein